MGATGHPPARVSSLIIATRIVIFLLVAGALLAAIEMTSRDRHGDHGSACYVCPMHSEVRSAEPGECPICGMKLERTGCSTADSSSDLRRFADLQAVENIRRHNIIDFVRKRSLLPTNQELRGPAWVDGDGVITAVLYDDQIDALDPRQRGTFSPMDTPQVSYGVRRTIGAPLAWDRSTSRIRFRFDGGSRAEPGRVGWFSTTPRPRQVLTVPASAVLQSPEGPYVLVSLGGFRFVKRRIEIGETFLKEGFAVVLSGLRVNERVVARASFFVDADRRLGRDIDEAGSVVR
jgi:hypothetical protein